MATGMETDDSPVSAAGRAGRLRRRWQRFQHRVDPYSELVLTGVPFLVLLLVLGIPVVFNTYVSFFSWNGSGWPTTFVGLENYLFMLNDPNVVRSIWNTAIWTVGMLVVPPAVGLGMALLIDDLMGESLFKTLFFLPYAVSFVAIGITWRLMYNGSFGVVNEVLRAVRLGELAASWLGIPGINTYAMMVAQGWLFAAFAMVVYLAGLRSIPQQIVEATRIDGLSRLQRFRYVTLPMLRPFTTLVIATILFRVLKIFDIIWVMTGGGPFSSSETLAVTMYRLAFSQFKFGKGAAVANILTVLIVVVTVLYIRYNVKREVEY
jgi:ABC-type sugar transport system permease subunit